MTAKKTVHLLLALCLTTIGIAQDFKSDFKKAAEFYKNNQTLSMKVSVKGYTSKNDLKGNLISSGNMYRSGSKYYSSIMNNELICDGKSILLINHTDKQVIYKSEAGKSDVSAATMQQMDSLLAKKKGVSYKGLSGNLLEYVISTPGEAIIQTTVWLDKSTFAIKKISYLYNQNSEEYETEMYKTEIEYSSISTDKPADDKFKISALIEKKGKTYTGKGKLKEYQITEMKMNENYIKY